MWRNVLSWQVQPELKVGDRVRVIAGPEWITETYNMIIDDPSSRFSMADWGVSAGQVKLFIKEYYNNTIRENSIKTIKQVYTIVEGDTLGRMKKNVGNKGYIIGAGKVWSAGIVDVDLNSFFTKDHLKLVNKRTGSLKFSWQVQPETPPVVHHISMQHDEQHHIDENNDEFKDISNEKFTNRWALVTCQDCIYGRMEDKLMNAHENAAARRNAEFLNYGWASGDDFIHSKTNRGKLYSEIDPETLRVTHSWEEDE